MATAPDASAGRGNDKGGDGRGGGLSGTERGGGGNLKTRLSRVYFADLALRSKFLPTAHRKYEAECYFQPESTEPMKSAARSASAAAAYHHFTAGLAAVRQQEPINAEHAGGGEGVSAEDAALLRKKQVWERCVQDRAAALSALRFQR